MKGLNPRLSTRYRGSNCLFLLNCFQDSEKKREKREAELMNSELKMVNEEFMKVNYNITLDNGTVYLSLPRRYFTSVVLFF